MPAPPLPSRSGLTGTYASLSRRHRARPCGLPCQWVRVGWCFESQPSRPRERPVLLGALPPAQVLTLLLTKRETGTWNSGLRPEPGPGRGGQGVVTVGRDPCPPLCTVSALRSVVRSWQETAGVDGGKEVWKPDVPVCADCCHRYGTVRSKQGTVRFATTTVGSCSSYL